MNKKLIVWMIGLLVLSSLAFAGIEETGLVTWPDYYGVDDVGSILISEERTSNPIINNAERFKFVSGEAWIGELNKYPPTGYKGKIKRCQDKEDLSEDECLAGLLEDYIVKFNLNSEQQAYVRSLSKQNQLYLISTLGRSHGKQTIMAEWAKGHQMLNYIVTHENTHTYTTHKINLFMQIELGEEKLAEANADDKNEIRKKIKNMKQEALFVLMWLDFVGDNKAVHFTNYGQVNKKEMFSEAFALIFNKFFIKKLESFDYDKDYLIIEKYIGAHLLLKCFDMYKTYDDSTGIGVEASIDNWIDSNEKTISIMKRLRPQISERAGSCPPPVPEKIVYSGEAYNCDYKMNNGKMNIGACELIEVAEYEDPAEDSIWVGYNSNGEVTGLGSFKIKETVINVPSEFDFFGEVGDVDIFEGEISEGKVIIEGTPDWIEFYSESDDFETPKLERIKIINPLKAKDSEFIYVNDNGVFGEVDEVGEKWMLERWEESQEGVSDREQLNEIIFDIIEGESVWDKVVDYWKETYVWLDNENDEELGEIVITFPTKKLYTDVEEVEDKLSGAEDKKEELSDTGIGPKQCHFFANFWGSYLCDDAKRGVRPYVGESVSVGGATLTHSKPSYPEFISWDETFAFEESGGFGNWLTCSNSVDLFGPECNSKSDCEKWYLSDAVDLKALNDDFNKCVKQAGEMCVDYRTYFAGDKFGGQVAELSCE